MLRNNKESLIEGKRLSNNEMQSDFIHSEMANQYFKNKVLKVIKVYQSWPRQTTYDKSTTIYYITMISSKQKIYFRLRLPYFKGKDP